MKFTYIFFFIISILFFSSYYYVHIIMVFDGSAGAYVWQMNEKTKKQNEKKKRVFPRATLYATPLRET